MLTLNEAFSALSVRRRYEVWFLRMGLADGSGAWWFRYLMMNPGRGGCTGDSRGLPAQLWATWFPKEGRPQSFIQGFPLQSVELSRPGVSPVCFKVGDAGVIGENSCSGALKVDGHEIRWDLHYRSTFRVTLSSKGWIGFSRTPHSDATVSGIITLDGRKFAGDPLGYGVQGHNCGYRHRNFWVWMHAYFPKIAGQASTLEALVYEMPFGLIFRKVVLWHEGKPHLFRRLERECLSRRDVQWGFACSSKKGMRISVQVEGSGLSAHRLPYLKTDCTGTFEVVNNSLASAKVIIECAGKPPELLQTGNGAVLEIAGSYSC